MGLALNYAVTAGRLPIVQQLLDHGAPITITTSAMVSREDKPNTIEILETLLKYGWSVKSTGTREGRMTMNMMIARHDSEEIVQWFLEHGAPAKGVKPDVDPPIRVAAGDAPSIAVVRLLLSHGATLRFTGALHKATFRPGPDNDKLALAIMTLLLDEGIDINEIEDEGVDRLPRSTIFGDRGTALHVAAREGYVARAKLLVERGADPEKKSHQGYTAKDWAQINKQEDLKRYLEAVMSKRGMDVHEIDIPARYLGERSPVLLIP